MKKPRFPNADDREVILSVLSGRKVGSSTSSVAGLVAALTPSVLPAPLSLVEAVERLLHTLRKKDVRAFREVLKSGAEGDGWALVREDAPRTKPLVPADVERVLEEADHFATALLERGESMRRRGVATMLRASDPGARRGSGCEKCGVPHLIAADLVRRIGNGEGWFILVGRE